MMEDYDIVVVGAGPAGAHVVGQCREAGFAPWRWSTNWWAVATDTGETWSSNDLDASNPMPPIVGCLPASDPRILATIDAVEDRLSDQRGLVYPYDTHGGVDGIEGKEGTFALCTFWLAQAIALADRPQRARAVFERAAAYVKDLGLLATEVDDDREMLGDFPQAFSHIGLVNAAWAISEAKRCQAISAG